MKTLRQEIRYEIKDSVLVVRLKGRLLQEVAEDLVQFLASMRKGPEFKLVITLSEVTYMSSAAIGALVRIGSESKLRLAAPSEVVKKLLELGEILPLFEIIGTEEQAIESLSR